MKKFAIESKNPAFPVIWFSKTTAPARRPVPDVVVTVAGLQVSITLLLLKLAFRFEGGIITGWDVLSGSGCSSSSAWTGVDLSVGNWDWVSSPAPFKSGGTESVVSTGDCAHISTSQNPLWHWLSLVQISSSCKSCWAAFTESIPINKKTRDRDKITPPFFQSIMVEV